MSPAPAATLERLTRLQALTEQYSKFSNSHAGLALLLAATFVLIVRFLPAISVMHSVVYTLLAAALWLTLRNRIGARLYQRFGAVEEKNPKRLGWNFLRGMVFGFIAASAVLFLLSSTTDLFSLEASFPSARYFPMIAALVIAVHSALNKRLTDAIVVMLFGAAASSANNAALFTPFQNAFSIVAVFAVAVGLVVVGISEHMKFQRLERELNALNGGEQ